MAPNSVYHRTACAKSANPLIAKKQRKARIQTNDQTGQHFNLRSELGFKGIEFYLQGADLCFNTGNIGPGRKMLIRVYNDSSVMAFAACFSMPGSILQNVSGGSGWTRTTDLTLIRGAL